jgi:hypothetical protein
MVVVCRGFTGRERAIDKHLGRLEAAGHLEFDRKEFAGAGDARANVYDFMRKIKAFLVRKVFNADP